MVRAQERMVKAKSRGQSIAEFVRKNAPSIVSANAIVVGTAATAAPSLHPRQFERRAMNESAATARALLRSSHSGAFGDCAVCVGADQE